MASVALAHLDKPEPHAVRPASTADDIGMMFKLAEALVPTGFLPDSIKTAGQAVAIILAGRELGLAPMQAFRSLSLVKGKITINADLLLARFCAVGGRIKWLRDDDTGASLMLRHPNGGDPYISTFTEADARKAGLWGKPGPWSQYPRAMLRARCVTAGLKAIGWEPAAGVYDGPSEELPGVVLPAALPEVKSIAAPKPLATEEHIARILDLVAHPHCRALVDATDARLKSSKPLSAKGAETIIAHLEGVIAAGGVKNGQTGELSADAGLGIDDAKRPAPNAVTEGH